MSQAIFATSTTKSFDDKFSEQSKRAIFNQLQNRTEAAVAAVEFADSVVKIEHHKEESLAKINKRVAIAKDSSNQMHLRHRRTESRSRNYLVDLEYKQQFEQLESTNNNNNIMILSNRKVDLRCSGNATTMLAPTATSAPTGKALEEHRNVLTTTTTKTEITKTTTTERTTKCKTMRIAKRPTRTRRQLQISGRRSSSGSSSSNRGIGTWSPMAALFCSGFLAIAFVVVLTSSSTFSLALASTSSSASSPNSGSATSSISSSQQDAVEQTNGGNSNNNNNAAQQQQQIQQQADALVDLAASASNNYNDHQQQQQNHHSQQQQQQAGGSKAKKIQIVYIKVPLAKLRPSLAGSNGDHSNSAQGSSGSNYSTNAKLEQQQQQYETSSPSSLLSSSTTSSLYSSSSNKSKQIISNNSNNNSTNGAIGTTQHYGPQQLQQQQQASNSSGNLGSNGGPSGINGIEGYSSGIGSNISFGGTQQGHLGAGYSANNYHNSIRDSGALGLSSGFGNGASTSGASTAFSDYPRVPTQFNSNSNNYNNHHQNQFGAAAAATTVNVGTSGSQLDQHQQQHLTPTDYQSRLKQAKKTIIPIVVQVEHAIMENAQAAQNAAANYLSGNNGQKNNGGGGGNKYQAGRSHRQLGSGKRGRGPLFGGKGMNSNQQSANQLYGAATNEVAHFGDIPPGAQFINAANVHDINQITAQINAENAASAMAALAQADAAFGQGMPPVYGNGGNNQQSMNNMQHSGNRRPQAGNSQQAMYLQNAASALLANTHPVIQAAASGGIASVSKLGAKLGEIMALPSMQMPTSISQIGSTLPSALSSLTNTMGSQLAQSVQQVAKEHPMASSFARQIAQQAGIQLPPQFFGNNQQQQQQHQVGQMHSAIPQQQQQHMNHGQQMAMASTNQQQQQQASIASPQSLQNLKLSIGHNLQSAAAQLMGVNQKASAFAQQAGLLNGVGGTANQVAAFSQALKQLSSVSPVAAQLANQLASVSQSMSAAASNQQQQTVAAPPGLATASAANGQQQQQSTPNSNTFSASNLMEQIVSAAAANAPIQVPANIQQQMLTHLLQLQQGINNNNGGQATSGSANGDLTQAAASESSSTATKPAKTGLKSKFMSFFQPPKFISNLFSGWNDRADNRNDEGYSMDDVAALAALAAAAEGLAAAEQQNATTTTTTITTTSKAPEDNNKTTSLGSTTTSGIATTKLTTVPVSSGLSSPSSPTTLAAAFQTSTASPSTASSSATSKAEVPKANATTTLSTSKQDKATTASLMMSTIKAA